MLRTIESRIRLTAILIYLIVAAVCCGAVIYVYQLRNSIDEYKNNIGEYNSIVARTDNLIKFINETQQEANQYLVTREEENLDQFRKHQEDISLILDSLQQKNEFPHLNNLFNEIGDLLREKDTVIYRLSALFIIQESPDQIIRKLTAQEPPVRQEPVVITTVVQDTTIHVQPAKKRNFFQRLFSSKQEPETFMSISTTHRDTVAVTNEEENNPILAEITNYTQQLHRNYRQRINSIQTEMNSLLVADQEISAHLSSLLLNLYNNSIMHILAEVEKEEERIRHINNLSMITGGVALFFILLFIILIFQDVNRGFRNRKALEEANIRIRETMESRHKLLLSVSHDIKTPLNSILGRPELQSKTGNATISPKEISSIQSAGAHILALLNNLLEFSGLEQGVLQSSPLPFNLRELCEDIEGICLPLARQKGLSYLTDYSFDHSLHLLSDPLKIKQILLNILSNAIKYTPQGDVQLRVKYTDGKMFFRIADTGKGIEEEKINDLFKPFTRFTSSDSRIEGTGIGMYVVKGLTDLLQGNIDVQSRVGRGTTITVTIPAETIYMPESEIPRRILLIDDNTSYLRLMADMLTHLKHIPEICHSMEELQAKIKFLSHYDMVFTDMEMGETSGTHVLQKVRQVSGDIPVVVMTGRGDFNYHTAIDLGFSNYMPKPVTTSLLKSLLGGEMIEKKPENQGFELLEELFDHDQNTIREILETFISSTFNHICDLQQAIDDNDFYKAQRICHTMLPMCMQINATETVDILKAMDSRREDKPEDHPEWKKEIEELIKQTGKLIERIRDNYPEISATIA